MSEPQQPLSFRLCTGADKPALVAFMDEHWGSKHPLMHCEDYFTFYYETDNTHSIQFAVAEEAGKIVALAGYIWTAKTEPRDLWVSIWCAMKGKNGAGLELMAALPSLTHARIMACNNIRPKTIPFYTFLGYTATRLPHFYRLADKPLSEYRVARVANKCILPPQGGATLARVTEKWILERDFRPNAALRPHKDVWYTARRYFDFPRQSYDVYAVYAAAGASEGTRGIAEVTLSAHEPPDTSFPATEHAPVNSTASEFAALNAHNTLERTAPKPHEPPAPHGSAPHPFSALLVTRTVPVNGTCVLRIVDYIGAPGQFALLGNAIDALLQEAGAEYAECYCYGISPEMFAAAGFCERVENDANVIPNYLTPPLYENTEYYFFTSDAERFTMFKADGDQDKPNIVL